MYELVEIRLNSAVIYLCASQLHQGFCGDQVGVESAQWRDPFSFTAHLRLVACIKSSSTGARGKDGRGSLNGEGEKERGGRFAKEVIL